MEYAIISDANKQKFLTAVNEYLKKGWNLYGNFILDSEGNYHQALTK